MLVTPVVQGLSPTEKLVPLQQCPGPGEGAELNVPKTWTAPALSTKGRGHLGPDWHLQGPQQQDNSA